MHSHLNVVKQNGTIFHVDYVSSVNNGSVITWRDELGKVHQIKTPSELNSLMKSLAEFDFANYIKNNK